MTDHDPFDVLASSAEQYEPAIGDPTAVAERGRRRTARQRALVAGTAAVLMVAGAAVAMLTSADDEPLEVATAPVEVEAPGVPQFVANDAPEWRTVDVDGVVDRAGEPSPVYFRPGDGDGLVIVFGEGRPCLDERSCGDLDDDGPGDLGFVAERGPLGDWPVLFLPDATDDFHLGTRPDAAVPGVDGVQQFVGGSNARLAVEATSELVERPRAIVVAGLGGGGLGAVRHAGTVRDAFPRSGVRVLVDGFVLPLGDQLGSNCLLDAMIRRWGAEWPQPAPTVADVEAAFGHDRRVRTTVIVHRDDPVLRTFLGAVAADCGRSDRTLTLDQYRQALDLLEAELSDAARWDLVRVPSRGHEVLDRAADDPLTQRVHDVLAEQED